MRRTICLVSVLTLLISINALAYDIVYDPINHVTNISNEIVNFAKWSAQYVQEAQTEINTLQTYENTVLQVARMGDPAQLKNLPGISAVEELDQIYTQLQKDYTDIKAVTNPQNFQANFNSILSQYKQAEWNGFTAENGTKIGPNQGSFQFPTSSYNAVQTAQQAMEALDAQKKTLQQQRDAANTSLQSATTTAQVDKYHALINSLNGALADVNSSIQQLFNHSQMQQQQNAAAQKVYQASQAEQEASAAYQAIDQDMKELPSEGFRQLALWQN